MKIQMGLFFHFTSLSKASARDRLENQTRQTADEHRKCQLTVKEGGVLVIVVWDVYLVFNI